MAAPKDKDTKINLKDLNTKVVPDVQQKSKAKLRLKNPFKKQGSIKRDSQGQFTTGGGGLKSIKKFNWGRSLPVIVVVAVIGGFLIFKSFATSYTQCAKNNGAYVSSDACVTDSDEASVVRLYYTSFNRAPDKVGLNYWTQRLNGTTQPKLTLTQVAHFFINSDEGIKIFSTMSNEAFVKALYVNAFGRTADAGGLKYWTDQLSSLKTTRQSVIANFVLSQESKTYLVPKVAKALDIQTTPSQNAPNSTKPTTAPPVTKPTPATPTPPVAKPPTAQTPPKAPSPAPSNSKKFNVAVIGVGYAGNDDHADKYALKIFAAINGQQPFKSNSNQIVYRFAKTSNKLGCDVTAFGCNQQQLDSFIASRGIPADKVIVLMNRTGNGVAAIGGKYAHVVDSNNSANISQTEVNQAIHEFGHIMGLFDEYKYDSSTAGAVAMLQYYDKFAPEKAYGQCIYTNHPATLTTNWRTTSGPWTKWNKVSNVQWTKGCSTMKWYRPSGTSIMQSLSTPDFNSVSVEVIRASLLSYLK